ncbi:MAG TPA: ferrous iron transport protein A [Anaerolineae bacterium]|nr:ferrous iron transport protein A [Anaerolineae bacterium]
MEGQVVPLSHLHPGEEGIVQGLAGGHGLVGRLASLGFTPGVRVTMVQNFGRGPVIVLVRDTRVALGRGEAMKVLVERMANDQ